MKILKKEKSFTLVELLVVVAVIGILASLLLPSLGKARKKSQSAVCKSQLKQLTVAAYMLTEDNDDMLMHYQGNHSAFHSWRWQIAPYLQETSDAQWWNVQYTKIFDCPLYEFTNNGKMGLAYNSLELGGPTTWNKYEKVPAKLNSIATPAETLLIGDGSDSGTWVDNFLFPYGKHSSDETAFGERHEHGTNNSWVDGHVSWMKKTSLLSRGDYYWLRNK